MGTKNQMFLFLQSSFALRPTQVTYLCTLPASNVAQMRLSVCLALGFVLPGYREFLGFFCAGSNLRPGVS